jgi:hypothetical protein
MLVRKQDERLRASEAVIREVEAKRREAELVIRQYEAVVASLRNSIRDMKSARKDGMVRRLTEELAEQNMHFVKWLSRLRSTM